MSACRRRHAGDEFARWRRPGVIRGYAALVAREQAGFAISAILHFSLERHDAKLVYEFVSRVTRRREVPECFENFMFRLPGVRNVGTNMILKEIKTGVTCRSGRNAGESRSEKQVNGWSQA